MNRDAYAFLCSCTWYLIFGAVCSSLPAPSVAASLRWQQRNIIGPVPFLSFRCLPRSFDSFDPPCLLRSLPPPPHLCSAEETQEATLRSQPPVPSARKLDPSSFVTCGVVSRALLRNRRERERERKEGAGERQISRKYFPLSPRRFRGKESARSTPRPRTRRQQHQ